MRIYSIYRNLFEISMRQPKLDRTGFAGQLRCNFSSPMKNRKIGQRPILRKSPSHAGRRSEDIMAHYYFENTPHGLRRDGSKLDTKIHAAYITRSGKYAHIRNR